MTDKRQCLQCDREFRNQNGRLKLCNPCRKLRTQADKWIAKPDPQHQKRDGFKIYSKKIV
jgi:hypothetical protein